MPKSSFQEIILKLQDFWAAQGCLIWQPYYTQVGAGTMNPATFLRVLGPEPWNVAYVEPSIRPTDGRYGENPNRWQHFYQFQVILKPDPGNPQEIYLESLLALGIDPARHDIRFVEDNWASPALGAWGLGWEVWLDGQEITQFTYFQQAGGLPLEPVSVEITYGLERILIALQEVDTFLDIRWNERRTYGQLQLQGEREYCGYNFETADIERLRLLFGEYEAVMGRDVLFARSLLERAERDTVLDAFLSACRWVRIYYAWRPNLRDEGDNHLVELAVAGGAQAIVTRNVRDLRSGDLRFDEIAVLTPQQLLGETP